MPTLQCDFLCIYDPREVPQNVLFALSWFAGVVPSKILICASLDMPAPLLYHNQMFSSVFYPCMFVCLYYSWPNCVVGVCSFKHPPLKTTKQTQFGALFLLLRTFPSTGEQPLGGVKVKVGLDLQCCCVCLLQSSRWQPD
ncbi:hypothetical protein ILYODFUR_019787 [Ilyodon furcidens]|uniref:Uncharacterized protein n=1 Tax=Ilyodon furcidens TaxID=33524 RepID=A0ABV0T1M9_9TELE